MVDEKDIVQVKAQLDSSNQPIVTYHLLSGGGYGQIEYSLGATIEVRGGVLGFGRGYGMAQYGSLTLVQASGYCGWCLSGHNVVLSGHNGNFLDRKGFCTIRSL